jgi:hypothetical protein
VTTRIPKKLDTSFRIKVNDTMVKQVNKLMIWGREQIQKQKSMQRLTENTK